MLIEMFTRARSIAANIRSSRDSSLVANGPPAPGRLHFLDGRRRKLARDRGGRGPSEAVTARFPRSSATRDTGTGPPRAASFGLIRAAIISVAALGWDRFLSVKSRSIRIAAACWAVLLMALFAAPMAFADNGVGLAGPVTDKTVTFFCFGVIGFFVVLVIVLSLIQGRLEKRKEQRRYDLERYG